ncbi:hypothetical protein Tco_0280764 [Tanacetum coccineum]
MLDGAVRSTPEALEEEHWGDFCHRNYLELNERIRSAWIIGKLDRFSGNGGEVKSTLRRKSLVYYQGDKAVVGSGVVDLCKGLLLWVLKNGVSLMMVVSMFGDDFDVSEQAMAGHIPFYPVLRSQIVVDACFVDAFLMAAWLLMICVVSLLEREDEAVVCSNIGCFLGDGPLPFYDFKNRGSKVICILAGQIPRFAAMAGSSFSLSAVLWLRIHTNHGFFANRTAVWGSSYGPAILMIFTLRLQPWQTINDIDGTEIVCNLTGQPIRYSSVYAFITRILVRQYDYVFAAMAGQGFQVRSVKKASSVKDFARKPPNVKHLRSGSDVTKVFEKLEKEGVQKLLAYLRMICEIEITGLEVSFLQDQALRDDRFNHIFRQSGSVETEALAFINLNDANIVVGKKRCAEVSFMRLEAVFTWVVETVSAPKNQSSVKERSVVQNLFLPRGCQLRIQSVNAQNEDLVLIAFSFVGTTIFRRDNVIR